MIYNPDPSNFRIKKLRQGDYILVSKAILRRRKLLRKGNIKLLYPIDNKQKLGRPKLTKQDRLSRNFFK